MGIVHHSNYPVWYEVARTEFIKKVGITYTDMEKLGLTVPLIELQCRYLSPAFYEDELIVEVNLVTATNVKLEFRYKIYRKGEDKPINTGMTMHAIVDHNMKPMNFKKQFPDIYNRFLNAIETVN
jgi:acyl-CoA thioester hydrolase